MAKLGRIIAVCDVNEAAADALATKYGTRKYVAISSFLSNHPEMDVVAVCTPNGLHAEHAIAALEMGFNVLCEKPMALTARDCEEMITIARNHNRKLFVVKQNRFNPPVATLKKLLTEGKLGKVLSFQLNCFWNRGPQYYEDSWHGSAELDGGTLFTQFSHFIDLVYWLFGEVDRVHAVTANLAHIDMIDFEDTGAAILTMQNGAIGAINYTVNSFRKNMEGSLTVFGDRGTVKIGGQYLNLLEYQNISDYHIPQLVAGNPANNYGEYVGSMSNHDKVYENIAGVLRNEASMIINPEDGLKTVEIINRIYDSARFNSGQSV